MNWRSYLLILVLIALDYSLHALAQQPLRIVDDFGQYETGKFPVSFRTYPFQRGKAMQVYSVVQEGANKFLRGSDSRDISVQVFKRFNWKKGVHPHFSWRWRAQTLPQGAAENNRAVNDSACGVYVLFGGYTGNVLKYVWSSTLPVETIHEKKPNTFWFIVKESGPKDLGNWKTVSVNILEDYRKVFKKDPEDEPTGIGLLTDGNATHTPAECDYDDFRISPHP